METIRNTINKLKADRDINGHLLTVGTVVRSFDFSRLTRNHTIVGMDLEGERVSYAEGRLEAIGEDTIKGSTRYRIRVDVHVETTDIGIQKLKPSPPVLPDVIYPPLNGSRYFYRDHLTFGVVAVRSENQQEP